MSEFRPTDAQRAAIEIRGGAVLVSAGAGSGKTKVLTERLMGYICDSEHPADLDSFLIITFTRAAAAELRGRISEELAGRLAEDPANRRLRRQSALCQRAQIGTIHSFCAALLREHCHELSLSPDFKIADEERADAMKAAALMRVLEQRYERAEDYPGFTGLADTVGAGRDDSRLAKLVLSLHAKMQCHARPELWARRQVELLRQPAADVSETIWGREVLEWLAGLTDYWCGEFERLMEEMRAQPKIEAAYMASFADTAEQLRELRRSLGKGWDAAREHCAVGFPTLGRLVNSPDPALSERLKKRRDACKRAMPAAAQALGQSSATLLEDMRATAPAMEALLSLTLDFDAAFARDKRSRGLVDYSDLEHLTARLLTQEDGSPSGLGELVSRRYTEIMVDEYQDVSRVQDAIFRAVSREGKNLFLVGDVKQSVYRFRLADPEIFNEKYLSYADYENAGDGQPRRILLRENFRSRREVLEGANSVFSLCMSRALGDMDYDGDAALRYGADYEGEAAAPELLLLDVPRAEDDEESPERTALEADMTAARIRALVESGEPVTVRGVRRPVEYGDIAILLRSANTVGGIYSRALLKLGIPVASVQGGGYFSSVEISAVTSMLAVIDNPHQDIALIAALRSPAFGFTADELTEIRAADRRHDLYTALQSAAESSARCRDFTDKLSALRAAAPDLSTAELVWQLLEELDMFAMCSAMEDGDRRRANLGEMIELAGRFESTGYRGLHRFVLWLRKQAEKGREPVVGAAAASAVQIMSIHKSKGLEFPVVFLCDTARRFNKQDSRDTVLVHPELGLGPKLTDTARRVEYPTLARNAIRLRLERETLSEEMRLLYVALTRARERLFVTAAVKSAAERVDKLDATLSRPMAPELLRQAGSMADWLIYACLADNERFRLSICAAGSGGAESAAFGPEPDEEEGASAQTLRQSLSFRYPHEAAQALPSKVTATELKGRADGGESGDPEAESLAPKKDFGFRLPDFTRKDRPVTGSERGVATHLVLQYIDLDRAAALSDIHGEIERLRRERFISDREAAAVDAAAIERLFSSPLGRRIIGADERLREFKFSLLWDAAEIYPQADGEELLMQGVVDCCIREGEELTIIDYKTDRVRTAAETAQRAALYKGQIMAYAQALQRICGRSVRECTLYFISAGRAVTVYERGKEEKTRKK